MRGFLRSLEYKNTSFWDVMAAKAAFFVVKNERIFTKEFFLPKIPYINYTKKK